MLKLKPIVHETIWGGTKLLKYYGEAARIGHLYSVVDEPEHESLIENGPYAGRTLNEWFAENRERFGLSKYERFPLIIALVDAAEHLSIQVHPDDAIAGELEGAPFGKNESWYFLEAPVSGWIYNGCRGNWLEESGIDHLSVRAGDYVYVEAGTVHALTAGSYLYEIEENSPYTYRIYDFERTDDRGNRRELHVEKASQAVKPEKRSAIRRYNGEAIRERMYETEELRQRGVYRNESGKLECLTVVEGAEIGVSIMLEPGETYGFGTDKTVLARII